MSRKETPHGIALEYETFGSSERPPLLLISGLGAQLVSWPRPFCQRLAGGGRFVIAFDNRDCGLSSKLDGQGADLSVIIEAAAAGDLGRARSLAAYTLSDMSNDAVALLDALHIERAHVIGSSLGGAIAQTMAIEHPERLLSLTSMMSSTGEPDFGQSTPEAMQVLFTPAPPDRDAYIQSVSDSLVWRSRKYPDLDSARQIAADSYDRCFYPEGVSRQLAAMIASGSRADSLRNLTVPTLVIHGLDDTLITPSGGERTAELIPGAHLVLIEAMGHDRPVPLWPQICETILRHTS
jgi:pimeloyl-ACP methyl ester carboxylesterase